MAAELHTHAIADNICYRCRKKVFFNERGPPFLTRNYHSKCFRCESCNKMLYAGMFRDHADDPYCEQCHERLFGGNRKRYATPDKNRKGEVDRADPLKQLKSAKKEGKLDIKKFSEIHKIPSKMAKAQEKHQKLHKYMIGSSNETLKMDGRMNYVHSKLRKRLHAMIEHQCQSFQQKLIQRVDRILEQEILNYDQTQNDQQRQHIVQCTEQIDDGFQERNNEMDAMSSDDMETNELIRRLSSSVI